MAIANVQSTGASDGTGGVLTIASTFVSTPTVGNLVTANILFFDGTAVAPTVTVDDGASHSFTVSATNSGTTNMSTAGWIAQAYILSAPSGMGKTITAHFSKNTGISALWIDEFSGGTFTVDMATVFANGSANPAVTPNITVTGTDVCSHVNANSNSMTTFNSPWTGNSIGLFFSNGSAYAINRSSNTAVSFNNAGGEVWNSLGMSFTIGGAAAPTSHLLSTMGAGT